MEIRSHSAAWDRRGVRARFNSGKDSTFATDAFGFLVWEKRAGELGQGGRVVGNPKIKPEGRGGAIANADLSNGAT